MGRWESYSKKGSAPIAQFPEPYFWRAPTDNDFGNNMPLLSGVWRTAHANRSVKQVIVGEKNEQGVRIEVQLEYADINVPYVLVYQVRPDGSVAVEGSIDLSNKSLPELPRFGMRLILGNEFDRLRYYGRGPFENYIDRNTSALIGEYERTVNDQFVWSYIRPQENGNHTDVRWLRLQNEAGRGIKIEGLQPLGFSALNVSAEDLDPGLTKKQQHTNDIFPREHIFLHVDLLQRGVGGDNSWGALPHDPYRLRAGTYRYGYVVSLF